MNRGWICFLPLPPSGKFREEIVKRQAKGLVEGLFAAFARTECFEIRREPLSTLFF